MSRRRKSKGGRGRQRNGRRGSNGGTFTNRRNPSFGWVSLYDIWLNAKERVYCWWNRVPQGSSIRWNRKGKIVGHYTRSKRPWFS